MKKLSFLFVNAYYPAFLKYFYNKNKDMIDKSYDEQKVAVISELFGTANFYSSNLIKLGFWANDIILNNKILQKQWAREHGIKFDDSLNFSPSIRRFSFLRSFIQKQPQLYWWIKETTYKKSWIYQILLAQIKEYKPDILYVLDVNFIVPAFLSAVKKYVKMVVGQIASLLPPPKYLKSYDLIISSLPHYVEKFRKMGIKSEYMKLAFEPLILEKLSEDKDHKYEVTHIGSYGSIHNERNELLEEVARKVKVDFWGYGIDNLKKDSLILKNYHGECWGIDMYNILYNSKITLTKHITKVAGNYANNARLYEATGCGTLLLVDKKDNLGEIFKIGKEVVVYENTNDLVNKIKYYLSHNEEREKIAKAGQKRTLKDHTYAVRTRELLDILKKKYQYYG